MGLMREMQADAEFAEWSYREEKGVRIVSVLIMVNEGDIIA